MKISEYVKDQSNTDTDMAGVPRWQKETIQKYKSVEDIDSENEDFINQLVESDMQRTTLSLSLNPPIMAMKQPRISTQGSNGRKPSRDPRIRQGKQGKAPCCKQPQEKGEIFLRA